MLRFTLRGSKFKKNLGGLTAPPLPPADLYSLRSSLASLVTRFARNSLRSLVSLPLYPRIFGSPPIKKSWIRPWYYYVTIWSAICYFQKIRCYVICKKKHQLLCTM